MMAVGALVNHFSPPGPEWAVPPLNKEEAYKVVRKAATGGHRVSLAAAAGRRGEF